eukprot:289300-Amorphochlora_amoeboformis.AAC.1
MKPLQRPQWLIQVSGCTGPWSRCPPDVNLSKGWYVAGSWCELGFDGSCLSPQPEPPPNQKQNPQTSFRTCATACKHNP